MKNLVSLCCLVVAVSMVSCNLIKSKIRGGKAKKHEMELPYEVPPSPPIPPEKYCFESQVGNGAHSTAQMEIAGDSVFAVMDFKPAGKPDVHGNLAGVIYGNTIIARFEYKEGGQVRYEDHEWKFVADSLFRRLPEPGVLDTLPINHDLILESAFRKVPCK